MIWYVNMRFAEKSVRCLFSLRIPSFGGNVDSRCGCMCFLEFNLSSRSLTSLWDSAGGGSVGVQAPFTLRVTVVDPDRTRPLVRVALDTSRVCVFGVVLFLCPADHASSSVSRMKLSITCGRVFEMARQIVDCRKCTLPQARPSISPMVWESQDR